jgi:hypothetical protein
MIIYIPSEFGSGSICNFSPRDSWMTFFPKKIRWSPGLRVKVGHIWVILILFSSSKTLKMYSNRYSKMSSSLCEQVWIYIIFMYIYRPALEYRIFLLSFTEVSLKGDQMSILQSWTVLLYKPIDHVVQQLQVLVLVVRSGMELANSRTPSSTQ